MSMLLLVLGSVVAVILVGALVAVWVGIGRWPHVDRAGIVTAEDWPREARRHRTSGTRVAVAEIAPIGGVTGVAPSRVAVLARDEVARTLRRSSVVDGVGWLRSGRLAAIVSDAAGWSKDESATVTVPMTVGGRRVGVVVHVGTATFGTDGRSVRAVVAAAERRAVAEAACHAPVSAPRSLGSGVYASHSVAA